MIHKIHVLATLSLCALATGFGPAAAATLTEADVASKPAAAQPMFHAAVKEGDRNMVLNLERAGLAAMDAGDDNAAAPAFDDALARIETVYADNPRARAARSKFTKEAAKDYKGEPYERAMAYYYRGLLYIRANDFENARASFRGGLLQDQLAEDQRYDGDFALLDILAGWSAHCLGQEAQAGEFYAEAAKMKPGIATPSSSDYTLLIAEIGDAPIKFSDGKYHENLHFRRAEPRTEQKIVFAWNGATVPAVSSEDVYYHASTRGGRQIDGILAGKASFKATTSAVSEGSAQAAMVMSQGAQMAMTQANSMAASGYTPNYGAAQGMAYASLAMGAISLFSGLASAAAKPQADIRYWDTLPDTILFTTTGAGQGPTRASFLAADGSVTRTDTVTTSTDPKSRCTLGWTRAHRAYDAPASAPNSDIRS
jgi:tetratricopeptide (TPR) repeat protein